MRSHTHTRPPVMYDVDICLLIDKTGSMRPFIENIKARILRLYDDVKHDMDSSGKKLSNLRIRIITFGDYIENSAAAFCGCEFLHMPDQRELLTQYVNSIYAEGGGDETKDGLEALALGIRSKWCLGNNKKRHIICLFTDAAPHALGFRCDVANYPTDVPKTFEELYHMWGADGDSGEMDQYAKRFILFAPDCSYWAKIAREWDSAILLPVQNDKIIDDTSYQLMIEYIRIAAG